MEMEKARRIEGVDFIRALCAIGIICHHYSTYSLSSLKIFFNFTNGSWGDVLVTIFFILSGGMLYYNYPQISSIKKFYFKRIKAIFPAFYIAFSFFYLENIYAHGQVFYLGSPWKILLSVIGMDGYLGYAIPNYYILGEWFLGAIIILYVLYPLLLILINKYEVLFTILFTALFVWENYSRYFVINPFRNMLSCIISFWIGMLLFKHKDLLLYKKGALLVSLVVAVVLYFVFIPFDRCILEHFMGVSLFIVLFHLGKIIEKIRGVKFAIKGLSRLSYCIFLLQHIVILKILGFKNPVSGIKSVCLLVITIVMTAIYAKVLSVINNSVITSRFFKKIEDRVK